MKVVDLLKISENGVISLAGQRIGDRCEEATALLPEFGIKEDVYNQYRRNCKYVEAEDMEFRSCTFEFFYSILGKDFLSAINIRADFKDYPSAYIAELKQWGEDHLTSEMGFETPKKSLDEEHEVLFIKSNKLVVFKISMFEKEGRYYVDLTLMHDLETYFSFWQHVLGGVDPEERAAVLRPVFHQGID